MFTVDDDANADWIKLAETKARERRILALTLSMLADGLAGNREKMEATGRGQKAGRWVTIKGKRIFVGGPGGGAGGAPGGGGRAVAVTKGIPSGQIVDNSLRQENEETILGDVIIDYEGDEKPTDDDIRGFLVESIGETEELPGLQSEDIEDIQLTSVEHGPGYVKASVDITPTEEAGYEQVRWESGEEEWATYHELQNNDSERNLLRKDVEVTNGQLRNLTGRTRGKRQDEVDPRLHQPLT